MYPPPLARVRSLSALAGAALTAALASPLVAAPPSSDYRLFFADEFNGTTLDTSKWSAASPGWTMPNSASTASASMVSVGGGALTLSAARNGTTNSFTSGSVSSYQKFNFSSGYVEARILLPNTVGSWPAFWGLYNGWPPEADIMEYPLTADGANGYPSTDYHTAFHYTNTSGSATAGAGRVNPGSAGDLRGSYHTFGMDWVANTSVAFYFDGAQVSSFTNSAVSQMPSMYMILDYAVGGWPGTPSLSQWAAGHTDQTKVDYVRVYQKNAGDPTATWNVSGGGSWDTSSNWSGAGGLPPRFGNQTAYFGRVGSAASAVVSIPSWHVVGGITFDGNASGTTIYVIGSAGTSLQLASTTGTSTVQATAASTASHAINSRLELWTSTLVRNDMTGGQTLNLNGDLSGSGSLSVDGPGTVILGSPGTYTGGTNIDAGAQGPAVLRVNASEALGTGNVVIGPAGNDTTARLELYGSRTLSNPIDFRGRNNPSVGIQSIRGDNALGGTVTLSAGGQTYFIESAAGCTLALTNPTAVTSNASSLRFVTLQGAGSGTVGGAIVNGASGVGVTKNGSGTWTLSGNNTYLGATTVNAGKLVVNAPALGPILTGAGGADITNGKLALGYNAGVSPRGTVIPLLRQSYLNNHFATGQIRASTVDANHAIAWVEDGATQQMTLSIAWHGDLNLDGTVDLDDYALMDRGAALGLSGWINGDVNYDDVVDAADYLLADRAFVAIGGSPDPSFLATRESEFGAAYVAELVTSVPEPSAVGGLAAIALLAARRTRQNR